MDHRPHPLLIARRVGFRKLNAISWLCLTGDALFEAANELEERLEDASLASEERERIEEQVLEISRAWETVSELEAELHRFAEPELFAIEA